VADIQLRWLDESGLWQMEADGQPIAWLVASEADTAERLRALRSESLPIAEHQRAWRGSALCRLRAQLGRPREVDERSQSRPVRLIDEFVAVASELAAAAYLSGIAEGRARVRALAREGGDA
jgi:hypothetical protein